MALSDDNKKLFQTGTLANNNRSRIQAAQGSKGTTLGDSSGTGANTNLLPGVRKKNTRKLSAGQTLLDERKNSPDAAITNYLGKLQGQLDRSEISARAAGNIAASLLGSQRTGSSADNRTDSTAQTADLLRNANVNDSNRSFNYKAGQDLLSQDASANAAEASAIENKRDFDFKVKKFFLEQEGGSISDTDRKAQEAFRGRITTLGNEFQNGGNKPSGYFKNADGSFSQKPAGEDSIRINLTDSQVTTPDELPEVETPPSLGAVDTPRVPTTQEKNRASVRGRNQERKSLLDQSNEIAERNELAKLSAASRLSRGQQRRKDSLIKKYASQQ